MKTFGNEDGLESRNLAKIEAIIYVKYVNNVTYYNSAFLIVTYFFLFTTINQW